MRVLEVCRVGDPAVGAGLGGDHIGWHIFSKLRYLVDLRYNSTAMASIALNCPHCFTQKAAFSGNACLPSPPGQQNDYIVFLQCPVCGGGVIVKVRQPVPSELHAWLQGAKQGNVLILEQWPTATEAKAPEHVPQNIQRFYIQGMDNLSRENWDAAGTMFRKALDTSLKHLDPSGKGVLQKRIDNLPTALGVTPAMKEWAHEIRELGNDAAHEEDPFTGDEAKTLQAFTELFLTYTFTLPGMLVARKAAAAGASSTPSSP
jgi:hypothetical protein